MNWSIGGPVGGLGVVVEGIVLLVDLLVGGSGFFGRWVGGSVFW